jgi:predicted CoA-binding protein
MMSDPDDAQLRGLLTGIRVVALVGASANADRPSHGVGQDLRAHGFRVIPVNPGLAGKTLWGETVVARLADIPPEARVEMIDVFRRSDQVSEVVDEAVAHLPRLVCVWMQLGVINADAAARARAAGKLVVMNRCPSIELRRLGIARKPC